MNRVFKRGAAVALAIATSVSLSAGALVTPLAASADLISDLQAQIAALQAQLAALAGGTSTGGSTSAKCTFTRALTVGSRGDDVTCLQNYLKSTGHFSASATGYFGNVTKAAAAAWQSANGVSPAAGYFGTLSQAKYNALTAGTTTGGGTTGGTTGGGTTTTPVGKGLTVTTTTQPAEALAPASAARVPFTKAIFTASADGDVTVKSVTVERQGPGQDAGLSGVVLLDENGVQIGVAKTLNSNHQVVLNEPFVVKAGTSRTITVAGNRASSSTSVAGEIVKLAVVAVDAGSSTVSGSLPIVGNGMTMNTSLTIGTVTMARGAADPNGNQSKEIGTAGYTFTAVRVTAGSQEKVYLKSIRWNQSGSAGASDLANVKTYVGGTAYNADVSADGKYYTTVFSGNGLLMEKGNSLELAIKGDIVGGSARTIAFDLYRETDLDVRGETYGFGITPPTTGSSGVFGSTNPWFDASVVTVSNGTMTVEKAVSVAAQNVAVNVAGQPLGGFTVDVKGEAISVASMVFRINRAVGSGATANTQDITNIALYDNNGAVVAGPVDVSSSPSGTQSTVTFSDTVVFPIGKNTYTLKGKIGTDFASNDTIVASTTPSSDWTTVKGQVTGNTITPAPTSAITMNTMTVKAAAITISVSSEPVAQTVVSGANQFTFAKYQLDATASGEDIKFTSIPLEYTPRNGSTATNLTSCTLYDGATALQSGSNVVNPSAAGSSTTFTFDGTGFVVPKGTVKTLDLKCNIAGGATGSYNFGYDSSSSPSPVGLTSGSTVASGSITENDSPGQIMTLTANGSLTVTKDSSSPSYAIVAAGTSNVVDGVLKFHATSEAIKLQKLALQLSGTASNSPTDLTRVTLWDGATKVGETVFTGSSDYATTTLTSDFIVPKDGDKLLTIKVDLAAVGTSQTGTEGALIKVDYDGGDSTGTQGVGMSSGSTINQGSTSDTAVEGIRMFKSYPTFAKLSVPTTALTTGTMDLYRFSVKADASGSVGIYKFTVNIATSSTPALTSTTTVANLKIMAYTDSGFSSPVSGFSTAGQLNTTIANLFSGADTDVLVNGVSSGQSYLQIPAGSTYYFRVVGDVTLVGGPTSGFVVTKVLGDAGYPSLATTFVSDAIAIDADTNDDFIWSPNATTTADTSSNDWTNGYFVSGLPSDNMDAQTIVK